MNIELLNTVLKFIECPYEIKDKTIESGQRTVYIGSRNNGTERFIIKYCRSNPATIARLNRETKILGDIDSPYFPKQFFQKTFTEEDKSSFLDSIGRDSTYFDEAEKMSAFMVTVEEYIAHIPWNEVRGELKKVENLLEFITHYFQALKLLWDKKVVHRDLKPDNILIRTDLRPVIIDLGIAKSLSENTAQLTHQLARTPCTPQFAAPEQLFDIRTEITYKSDQFSTGVILYQLLTDKFPFGNFSQIGLEGVITNMISGTAPKPISELNENIPYNLAMFVQKLIAIEPFQRFRNYDSIEKTIQEITREK